MALFISLTATRLRRMLLVFFILASLFPVIMTLLVSFQYVLPVLGNAQIERLREVFNNTILAILLIQLLSFCLFWGWIKSWETLKEKISLISAEILKKKQIETLGENELQALLQLFQELQKEFQAVMGRLNEYFRRSITDDLTRLFNRNYFKFKLTEEVKRSEHLKQQLSLIVFNVDDFGLLEDGVGDKLLKDIGQLMRKVIRKADLPFRYGRNQFALLLPGCSSSIAEMLAQKLAKRISAHAFADPQWLPVGKVSISGGVAGLSGSPDQFLADAEDMLSKARSLGKGFVVGPSLFEETR